MSRIRETLRGARASGKTAFIGFLVAGDPSLDKTVDYALALERGGAAVLELGVPFSDPLADGPVIQRASERALRAGATLAGALDVAQKIRARSSIPIVLFSYLNPIHRYGLERLARDARGAGVDGALITDLPPEEASRWIEAARRVDLDTIFLAAPTSPDHRLRGIAAASRGFVYAVSRTGVTGERAALSEDASPLVSRIKALTSEPVALGFGISAPSQVAAAASVADAVVVGSALVRFIEDHPGGDLCAEVRRLCGGAAAPDQRPKD